MEIDELEMDEGNEMDEDFEFASLDPRTVSKRAGQFRALFAALADKAKRAEACRKAGVKPRTFYNWINADEDFKRAVEDAERQARERDVDDMEDVMRACARMALTDPRYQRSLFFYMKCRAGWSDRPPQKSKSAERDEAERERQARERAFAEMDDDDADVLSATLYLIENGLTLEQAIAEERGEEFTPPTPPHSHTLPHAQTPTPSVPSSSIVDQPAPNSSIVNRHSSLNETVPSVPSAPATDTPAISPPSALNSSIVIRKSTIDESVPSVPFPPGTGPSPIQKPVLSLPKDSKSKIQNHPGIPDPKRHQSLNWRAANENRNKSRKR